MSNPTASILRAATRKIDEPLNILTFPTHEALETNLCKTGHNFYAIRAQGIKDWNNKYRPLPDNYILLDPKKEQKQIPLDIDFDLVLSQNKFGQMQIAKNLSRLLQLPLISLEHTLPPDIWPKSHIEHLKGQRGHLNVFISEYSREAWGWKPEEALVVHHGINTDTFKPNNVEKKNSILSVVNDFKNRSWCCGFELWQQITNGLSVSVVGDTPGLSLPSKNISDLINSYNTNTVFLNTSLISPIPMALLEAMSCGCAVVSTATCMIPEIIQNGVNGFISNKPEELRQYCQKLLSDNELNIRMGEAARKTILENFSLDTFVNNWNRIFTSASEITYVGEP